MGVANLCIHQSLYSLWMKLATMWTNWPPLVLNTDSKAMVEIGIANTSLAIVCNIGYFKLAWLFHHARHRTLGS